MTMHKAATILIIDDSPEDRHTYRAFLSQHDDCLYTFLEADDAEEGLRIYAQAHVDLILLDYQLPDLSGLDVLARLRSEEEGVPTPVVMTTGRGNEEVAVQALKAGVVDYLVKSAITPGSLYRATRNALERARLTQQLAQETADREQAELELRDSEERLRLLVESVQDYAIIMLDTEGRISAWNTGARAMFGYHDREILGQHYRRLFTQEDVRARVPERELEEASRRTRSSEERWHVHRDGTRLSTVGSLSPVRDATGLHRGYSKVLRDMTERRKTLQRMQEALDVRDDFLAVASHELRTPLAAAMLKTQGLLRKLEKSEGRPLDPDILRATLRDASGQLERLHETLENLLDVSRVGAAEAPMQLEPLDLGAVVQEILDAHAPALKVDPKLVKVHAVGQVRGMWDRARLTQVLLHVLDNAIKHAPGLHIVVRVERVGSEARITVGDERASAAHAEAGEAREQPASALAGAGIGLYISRHVLRALGGTMRVHGELGRGATFVLELATGDHRDGAVRPARV